MGLRIQQPQDEFELQRKRAQQEANAAKQQQTDALKRRFAATGMLNSGAAIQQERLANEAVDKQLSERGEAIDTAQRAEARRLAEIKEARDFAKAEREASQGFAREERLGSQGFQESMFGKQTAFQRGEREASQGFARGEREASQGFAQREREASQGFAADQARIAQALQRELFNEDMSFKRLVQGESSAQARQAYDLAVQQYLQDRQITDLNAQIAAQEAGVPWRPLVDTTGMDLKTGTSAIAANSQAIRAQREANKPVIEGLGASGVSAAKTAQNTLTNPVSMIGAAASTVAEKTGINALARRISKIKMPWE